MFKQKMTIAASIAVLSASLLASNANATECSDLTGNQLLAAIERGKCELQTANVQDGSRIIVEDQKWIRTSRNDGNDRPSAGKAGGGYKY